MVAGDHHGADTGGAALRHGVLYLRAHRVDHAGQTDEAQILLQILRLQLVGQTVVQPLGRRQYAEGLVGHGLVVRQNGGALFLRQGEDRAVFHIVGAAAQHLVRRALGVLDEAGVRAVDGGHHLPAGVEGRLGAAGLPGLHEGLGAAVGRTEVHQRRLGRLALRAALLQNGVVAQGHGGGQRRQRAGVLHHRHLVLGQSTGLVGADDLRAAQRLHGGEPPDDGVALTHVGHADAQYHRHHGGQTLRDGGHGQRHGHHERLQNGGEGVVAHHHQIKDEDEHADAQHQLAERLAQLGQLPLEGRLLLLRLGQYMGDLAHLRVHTGGGDDRLTTAIDHGAAHVAHIFPVTQRHVAAGEQLHRLGDGDAFAGEGGLLDLQGGTLQQPPVSGDGIAGLQHHHVAGYQLAALHYELVSAAQHLALGGGHSLEGFDGGLGLTLLHHAQNGVEQHHRQNDEHLGEALVAQSVGDGGHRRRCDQDQQHGVLQLGQKALEYGGLLRLLQLVGAVLGQTRLRLLRRQPLRGGVQLVQHLLRRAVIVLVHGNSSFLYVHFFIST